MSRRIFARRKSVADPLDAMALAPSAPRLTGGALRESLARFCPPVTIHLRPGERIIGGRVYYSAAWLDGYEGGHHA